ncbi:MAG: BadF/BadG/BcrA/BcrD ATPase family protein [Pseudomonadota bacterium]
MSSPKHTTALAVDGGGTRCRIAVQRNGAMSCFETGSANVSTDFDGAVSQVLDGLKGVAAKMAIDIDDLVSLPAFVGLAGVTDRHIAEKLEAALPLTNVRIEDDRPAALRGALGNHDGVIAHCGTGSFFGLKLGSDMRFSGGWGPVLGDEASAQWVGRAVLRDTLETVDGRRTKSELANELLDEFEGAAGIVRFAGAARPSDFGAIAPKVTDFAARGDALAERIMSAGASEIERGLTHIGWTPGRAICLTGGIGPQFESYLPVTMQTEIVPASGEPLSGALRLASELENESSK